MRSPEDHRLVRTGAEEGGAGLTVYMHAAPIHAHNSSSALRITARAGTRVEAQDALHTVELESQRGHHNAHDGLVRVALVFTRRQLKNAEPSRRARAEN